MNLPRISPAAAGISEEGIKGFLEGVRERGIELHDLMIVRGGKVCYEASWYPYGEARLHMLYSLSKAFTAVGAGFAVQEGLFAVEDTVYSFFRGGTSGYDRRTRETDHGGTSAYHVYRTGNGAADLKLCV